MITLTVLELAVWLYLAAGFTMATYVAILIFGTRNWTELEAEHREIERQGLALILAKAVLTWPLLLKALLTDGGDR